MGLVMTPWCPSGPTTRVRHNLSDPVRILPVTACGRDSGRCGRGGETMRKCLSGHQDIGQPRLTGQRSGGERPADAGARRQRGPRTAVKNRAVPPTVAVVWQRVAPGRWVSTRSRTQQGAYSANVAEDRRWTLRYSDAAGGHDERVVGRYDTLGQCRRAAQRHQDRNASGVVKPIEPLRWRRIRNGLYEADAENRRTYRAERGRDETGWVLQFYDGPFDVFSVVTLAHVDWLNECKVAAEQYRRTGTACTYTERKALGNAG
jgi:hypothetical protein